MKDLNLIANILCNYYDRRKLDPIEMEILCEWLSESQANEDFLTDLSDDANWIKNEPRDKIHDLIRSKLFLHYKH